MIAIVDYGVGNLFSLQSSLRFIGEDAAVTGRAEELQTAERIILPGVGAFGDAADKLHKSGLWEPLLREARAGKPILGICLGMQLLFEAGYEYGTHAGLGLLAGSVRDIRPMIGPELKTPHMGWNALRFSGEKHPLFRYVQEGAYVYFVHSYAATECTDSQIAYAEYGAPLTAAAAKGNVMGVQFHPEKSGAVGLNILRAFCETEAGVC